MTDRIKVGLFDGCFPGQKSMSLGGMNKDRESKCIEWVRDEYLPTTVFTDTNLARAKDSPSSCVNKIAWIVEPRSPKISAYKQVVELKDEFDGCITHDPTLLYESMRTYYCPVGGLWVDPDTEVGEKTKLVSMMTTEKVFAPGHQLRKIVADALKTVDLFGRGSNPIPNKIPALAPYLFTIVIESQRTCGYFTEKLLDAIQLETIPIYWGAPDIGYYLDTRGMIICHYFEEIIDVVNHLNPEQYDERREYAISNKQDARDYWRITQPEI